MQSETIIFNGVKFRRYPGSAIRTCQVYYCPSGNDRKKGVGFLHQEIWKAAHGPIPEGYHIHHRDYNPLNNDLENLEALPGFDHLSLHGQREPSQLVREHLEEIRPLASAWHRSAAGREWHSRNAKGKKIVRVQAVCEQCGTTYERASNKPSGRFCSNKCKSAWRRSARVDDETRVCPVCKNEFKTNRYEDTVCCSRQCAQRLRRSENR